MLLFESEILFAVPGGCVELIQGDETNGEAQPGKEYQCDRLSGKQDSDCHNHTGEKMVLSEHDRKQEDRWLNWENSVEDIKKIEKKVI